ncbi:MAG: DUF2878 domain-containing protein [Nitrospira sp.]|nr:DUF2878 domain-containing protein [Nitrospira sp.]
MSARTRLLLSNFLIYQIAWFTGVWTAATKQPWIGAIAMVSAIVIHLVRAPRREPELALVGIALVIGLLFDSLLVWRGWVHYPSGILIPDLAPYWMVLMWGLFATLLNVTLRWMHGRFIVAALLGAIGGPAAYYGGVRMGALQFSDESAALIALVVGWAIITPLLMALADRFNGYAHAMEATPS